MTTWLRPLQRLPAFITWPLTCLLVLLAGGVLWQLHQFLNRSNFPAVTSTQALKDYYENADPRHIARNSLPARAKGLRIVDGKWIFDTALGRHNVLVTHPCSRYKPSIYRVRTGGRPLAFTVHSHPKGDSRIEVWAGQTLIFVEDIRGNTWMHHTVSLPEGTDEVELHHVATGWHFEYLYWSELGPG